MLDQNRQTNGFGAVQKPRRTLIAVAVAPETTLDGRKALERHAERADLVELRIDGMRQCSLPELLRDRPCPVIVTNRAAWEGGQWTGSEEERIAMLLQAVELEAEYVDWELAAASLLPDTTHWKTRLILSSHDFTSMDSLATRHALCVTAGADIPKAVGMAQASTEAVAALDVLQSASCPSIALAMGAPGIASRILAPKYNAFLTFAAADGGGTAPGQVTLDILRQVFYIDDITPETIPYVLLSGSMPEFVELARINEQLRAQGKNAVVVPALLGEHENHTEAMKVWNAIGCMEYCPNNA